MWARMRALNINVLVVREILNLAIQSIVTLNVHQRDRFVTS